ncbi:hypothetical protein L7F22_034163 [Adiantum nelumboides]|nr:hypothetical protein [Adiantum nelumboides]
MLQVLCHLLNSDELWVVNEAERYKLTKQALIDWRLAQTDPTGEREAGSFEDYTPQKRGKSAGTRKSGVTGHVSRNSRTRSGRGSHSISKERSSRKKEGSALHLEPSSTVDSAKDVGELDLKRLRRLWESDSGQLAADGLKGGFDLCSKVFTAGGIIFAHLEVIDISQVKRELEDAGLSSDVANDSIWHHVLLKDHILKLNNSPSAGNLLSDSDEDDDDDEMEDEENDGEDDDEDLSELDTSDSDRWSTDSGDHSNSSDGRDRECSSREPSEVPNTSLVSFSSFDVKCIDSPDPARRKTTGGFTWSAKPGVSMQLVNFPPFRFGAEFVMKDKFWLHKSQEVFYGGSMWNIQVLNGAGCDDFIHCQLRAYARETGVYNDTRTEVRYRAKLFTKTISGLRYVAGVGVRSTQDHARRLVTMVLARDDVLEEEPLRISCVVQLIDNENM